MMTGIENSVHCVELQFGDLEYQSLQYSYSNNLGCSLTLEAPILGITFHNKKREMLMFQWNVLLPGLQKRNFE